MNRKKRLFSRLLGALLCAVLLTAAAAAQPGSLQVTVEGAAGGMTVTLYSVSDPQGVLTAPFAGAALTAEQLLDQKQNPENAALLASYAAEHALAGSTLDTDESGTVRFSDLTDGIYLVVGSSSDGLVFDPFLVYLPTVINGEALYDITATPKAEQPEDPENPDEPENPDDPKPSDPPGPNLPQTGVQTWLVYILVGAGALLVVCGIFLLIKGKKKDE